MGVLKRLVVNFGRCHSYHYCVDEGCHTTPIGALSFYLGSNTRMRIPWLVPGIVSMVELDLEGDTNSRALSMLAFPQLGLFP